ncbi:hypothetical protein RINTHH_20210 [Richelia intracellularis HH01]|uniref:Uncharacterized protein n=1 Tax=Richelia intracellularis HH01 TaxID=1165094 RepID=M1X6I9_9NOST|nr:hypothetical protein RINTHH_20210 [Richelia intracellularis HH01]
MQAATGSCFNPVNHKHINILNINTQESKNLTIILTIISTYQKYHKQAHRIKRNMSSLNTNLEKDRYIC